MQPSAQQIPWYWQIADILYSYIDHNEKLNIQSFKKYYRSSKLQEQQITWPVADELESEMA